MAPLGSCLLSLPVVHASFCLVALQVACLSLRFVDPTRRRQQACLLGSLTRFVVAGVPFKATKSDSPNGGFGLIGVVEVRDSCWFTPYKSQGFKASSHQSKPPMKGDCRLHEGLLGKRERAPVWLKTSKILLWMGRILHHVG